MIIPNRYVKLTIIPKNATSIEREKIAVFEYKNSKGYRIDFNIVKFASDTLNTASIQIYNLAEDTARFINEGQEVILEVGYSGKIVSVVYKGAINSITREKNNSDIITNLMCATIGRWRDSIVSKVVKKQKLGDFIDGLAIEIGLKVNRPVMNQIITGNSFFGSFRDILNILGNRYNFSWSDEDGEVKIKYNTESSTDNIKFKFTPASGLLRVPTFTEKGVDIMVMLDPTIKPNDRFELDARFSKFNLGALEFVQRVRGTQISNAYSVNVDPLRFRGRYTIMQCVYEGSTHDNVWQTTIEGFYPEAVEL